MNWFTKAMVIALAALWPLVTSHCKIEVVSNFTFLACGDTAEAQSHESDGCDTDACAVIESGFYKTEERQVSVLPPSFVVLFELATLTDLAQTTEKISILPAPELSKSWQFTQRVVASPRAPSIAS